MRHLLPALAAAHVLGIAAGEHAPAIAGWLWLGLHAAALGLVARRARTACALGVAFAAGALALAARIESARAVRLAEPVEAVVEARVGAVLRGANGPALELREVRAAEPRAALLPPALLVYAADAPRLAERRAGAWIRAALRVVPPRGARNPGGRDRARALARRGLGASATLAHPDLHAEIQASGPNWLDPFAEFRLHGARRLLAEGPGGGLLAALGLGEAAALGPEPRAALAKLGLSHVVAVSGLHLWLVAGPLYLATAALVRRSAALAARRDTRRIAIALALAGSALYALLTGLAPPVQRALACLAGLALSQLARRPLAPAQALGAAALAVAAGDPAAPFAPGVQLSFAATAALLWSAPARAAASPALRARLRAAIALALRSSASATAVTAPLVAIHFGVVSPLGWLTNGVAVPLTSLALLPLALASGLLAASFPEAEGMLAAALAGAARLGDALLEGCVALAAITPARLGVAPGWLGVVTSSALALACVRARLTSVRLGLAALAAAAPALGPPPRLDPPPPRVVFLDVGQGDAAIVQGRRASVLIDAGTALAAGPGATRGYDAGEQVVVPALGALGVERLDLVIASHADLDHRGGLAAVLRSVPVARLWLPPGGAADPAFREVVESARARGVAILERGAGDPALAIGDLELEALWPPRVGAPEARNDASLVLRVAVAGRRLLFPGDLEATGELLLAARGIALGASVLKLGHHGSRTSSTPGFLAAVAPELAIVSAPLDGRFGMPHAEVIARLEAAGIAWRWTGREGAVLVGLGATLRVRGFAGAAPPRHLACGRPR